MKLAKYLLLSIPLIATSACEVPDVNPDKITFEEINTAIPIGTLHYGKVGDLVKIQELNQSFSKIEMSTGVAGYPSPISVEIPIEEKEETIELALDADDGAFVEEVVLKSGVMAFQLQYDTPSDVKLLIELPDFLAPDGSPLELEFLLKKDKKIYSFQADLKDHKLQPNSGKIRVKTSGVIYVEEGDNLDLVSIQPNLKLSGLEFSLIKGFFGNKTIAVEPQVIKLGDELPDFVKLGSKPVLKLIVENRFGVPLAIDFKNVTGIREDNSKVSLSYQGNSVIVPGELEGKIVKAGTTKIELNSENSSLASLFSSDVKEISFGVSMVANPGSQPGARNFLTNDGSIKITLAALVPVKINPGSSDSDKR